MNRLVQNKKILIIIVFCFTSIILSVMIFNKGISADQIKTIILSSEGATTAGTTKIYYNDDPTKSNFNKPYLNSNLSSQMTRTSNQITKPTMTGKVFEGYFTSNDTTLDSDLRKRKVIDKNGYFILPSTYLLSDFKGTLFAKWSDTIPNDRKASTTHDTLNVLVIEINPTLRTVTNNPKVSEVLNQSYDKSVNEEIEDFEDTSHGYLNINIVKREYLNEFPTYTKPVVKSDGTKLTQAVNLSNGTIGYRMPESTFLRYAYDSSTGGYSWWKLYENGICGGDAGVDASAYTFDYKYIIDKFDLVNRKNRNEFDHVWFVGIDPMYSYETMMVGNNPYWTNSPGYVADCPNFVIGGASLSRPDAQFHAFGHGAESIMTAVFNKGYWEGAAYGNNGTYRYYYTSYSPYEKNSISISSAAEYNNLNLWEKFNLNDYANSGTYNSVGTVHHPFNADYDYDYENTKKVYTNWRDWLNYPNISGNFSLDNNNAWMNNTINTSLGQNEEKGSDRLHMRLWFYLMPHITGYTSDGYLNNWWKYIKTSDFVASMRTSSKVTCSVGDEVTFDIDLTYESGKVLNIKTLEEGNNIQIDDKSVVNFVNGKLKALKAGSTIIKVYFDGKYVSNIVTVSKDEEAKSLQNAQITYTNSYTYQGQAIEPEVEVKVNNIKLTKSRDYVIKYENNNSEGEGKIVITGIGKYKDTVIKYFTITKQNVQEEPKEPDPVPQTPSTPSQPETPSQPDPAPTPATPNSNNTNTQNNSNNSKKQEDVKEEKQYSYSILDTTNSVFSNTDIIIKVDAPYTSIENIFINNTVLDKNYYKIDNDQITIDKNYLSKLNDGNYTIKIKYNNGKESSKILEINNKNYKELTEKEVSSYINKYFSDADDAYIFTTFDSSNSVYAVDIPYSTDNSSNLILYEIKDGEKVEKDYEIKNGKIIFNGESGAKYAIAKYSEKLSANEETAIAPKKIVQKKKSSLPIIIITLLILSGIGTGAYIFIKKKLKEQV